MLRPVELNVFAMAAETENFSEAARRLGVTQPTVSNHIRSLEDRLGINLFERSGRHVIITEAGRALAPLARDILQRCIQIEETMVSLHGEIVGHLQIGCTTSSGKYLLPRILSGLRKKHPRIEVTCKVTSRSEALHLMRTGEVHLTITGLREPAKALDYQEFTTDRIVLITQPDHPWASLNRPLQPVDLTGGEFINREDGSGTMAAIRDALAPHGLGIEDLPHVLELGNSEAIRIAVAEGLGVAFVCSFVATEAGNGDVAIVTIEGMQPQQTLFIARDTSRPATRSQAAFWDFAFSDEMAGVRERITGPSETA